MKEFGIYKLRQTYLDDFVKIDKSLSDLKIKERPFVCIKVKNNDSFVNWMIPLASINPKADNYNNKSSKYKSYQFLEKTEKIKAIHIVGDILGTSSDSNFKSVIEYYNALPVKSKYCSKYTKKSDDSHIVVNDMSLCKRIKKNFNMVLDKKKQKKEVGFIKIKIEKGEKQYRDYGKKSIEISKELYKKHFDLIKQNAQRKAQAQSNKTEKEINHIVKKEAADGKLGDAKKIAATMSFKELDQPLRCYLCLPSEKFITKNEKEEDCVKIKVANIKKPSLDSEKQIVPIKYLKTKMIGDGLFVTHVADQLVTDFKFQLKQVISSTKKVIIKK